jgi:hypothetical protein
MEYFQEIVEGCAFFVMRSSDAKEMKIFQDRFSKYFLRHKRNNHVTPFEGNFLSMSRDEVSQIISIANDKMSKLKDADVLLEIASPSLMRSVVPSYTYIKNKEDVLAVYDFLKHLNSIKEIEKVSLDYEFKYVDGVLKIKRFRLSLGATQVVLVDFEKANEKGFLSTEIADFSKVGVKQMAEIAKAFKNSKTVFSFIDDQGKTEAQQSLIGIFFVRFLSQVINKVEESFNSQRINYVSPLRAHPKRYYFLDKAKVNAFLDTLDGEAIAEILKENSSLKSSVNSWFKKFNLHIDVGPIKDIIHQIVVRQNALDLDITDVGFGVSQVLPVIIQGFLSKESSITLIEQPEIHLHPKMQADLADLFIEIAVKSQKGGHFATNKYVVVETHSEYLLKRLRRRLSEQKISADDVAIYYVESPEQGAGSVIRRIDIQSKGAFDWPKDFYTGELAQDVTEFLKNQI